jgi:hypothetical protein
MQQQRLPTFLRICLRIAIIIAFPFLSFLCLFLSWFWITEIVDEKEIIGYVVIKYLNMNQLVDGGVERGDVPPLCPSTFSACIL